MLIGLTYDLKSDYLKLGFTEEEVAEFDTEETVGGIENALQTLGYQTDRIGHVKELIRRIQQGDSWDIVFNICEGVKGPGREAQVPAVLDIYNIPYTFSDVCIMSLTLNKAFTKHLVMNAGFKTPSFTLINDLREAECVGLPFPLFVKPALEGTGKGIDETSLVKNKEALYKACNDRLAKGYAPLLIETYLPGREFTVGIVGTGSDSKVVGAMEVVYNHNQPDSIYSYETKAHYEELVKYTIPEKYITDACEEMALGIWKLLGCYDAGRIDVRMDADDQINFIEINPLAGLNYIHSDLPIICRLNNISYETLIKQIVDSAKKRYNLA
ncbi:MAG: D-alanine--D-alanine ligase B [Bacteroidetes bacterium ADurb.Bin408]|nr:MAG: D-alanine--D-alanine ligase B [Bacteroidetes bacterium ADurb.Bin408]